MVFFQAAKLVHLSETEKFFLKISARLDKSFLKSTKCKEGREETMRAERQ